ncbi:MAG: class I tRNA ligase family protein, partial [Clostridia bacterium]|nr:class I tRNA ligase family protein [Clostridia bacterium]
YLKRSAQGLILGPDGEKMSKSRGNVIDPLDIVAAYGADVLRTYILFLGDYGASAPWADNGVKGCRRFLERVASLTDIAKGTGSTPALERDFHKTVKKVTSDIEDMKFNTAIAALMTLLNRIGEVGTLTADELKTYVKLLSPFAPHLSEEIWEKLGGKGFVSLAQWPSFDEALTVDSEIEIAVQISGKLRGTVLVPADADRDAMLAIAKSDPKIAAALEGKTVIKEIVVPGKIVNIVAK